MPGRRAKRNWKRPAIALTTAVLIGAVVVGIVLAGRSGEPAAGIGAAGGETGRAAPALAGSDVVSGEEVSLADFEGTPVVINVWASWCPGCRDEAPALYQFAKAHPEAQLLGIDIQDTRSAGKAFHEEFKWSWPSIFDPSGNLSARLGLQGLPQTFFLNADHEIVAQIVGAGDVEAFEAGLRQALGT